MLNYNDRTINAYVDQQRCHKHATVTTSFRLIPLSECGDTTYGHLTFCSVLIDKNDQYRKV